MGKNDELLALASMKGGVDERILERVDFGLRIARVLYVVIVAIVVAAIWLAGLQWQVGSNRKWIEDREKEKLPDRMRTSEENGARRDRQIRVLFQHDFNVDPQ